MWFMNIIFEYFNILLYSFSFIHLIIRLTVNLFLKFLKSKKHKNKMNSNATIKQYFL